MAFDLSFGSLSSARDRLTQLREDDGFVARTAKIGLTPVTAFGFAWLEARFAANKNLVAPLGVPVSAIVGSVLSAAAIFDVAFGYEDWAASVGAGALSVFAASYGANMGAQQASAAAQPSTKTQGLLPQGQPAFHVSARDMASMGQRRSW